MSLQFQSIPSNHLGILAGVELDRQGTSPGPTRQRTLIVGGKTNAGTATANTVVLCNTVTRARALFGQGSQLALMVEAYLANDPNGEVYACGITDNGSGVAATGTIQVTAAATGDGTIYLYVAGVLVPVGVSSGDSANTIASAIHAAVGEVLDLPVTSGVVTNTVTLTARNKGVLGNAIDIRVNYRDGERLPSGVALSITAMASGDNDPSLTTANTAIEAADWRCIVYPYTVDAQQDALDTLLENRWDALSGKLGVAFSCHADTVANLYTWAAARNSPFASTLGLYASPTPRWIAAAAYAGCVFRSIRTHQAVPLANRVIRGVLAPAIASRFVASEIQTLGLDGVATTYVDDQGNVRIANAVTHYKTDSAGTADTTYQFLNAPYVVSEIIDRLQAAIRAECAGKILVDDASVVRAGIPAYDASMGKALVDRVYAGLVEDALCEDLAGFQAIRIVQRNEANPNRLDIGFYPDLANQLHTVAVLVRPYLQFPGA